MGRGDAYDWKFAKESHQNFCPLFSLDIGSFFSYSSLWKNG
jgi:hypothetical protein